MVRPAGWDAADPAAARRPVRADDVVAGVLDRHPELLPVFLEWGFRPLANPVLRRTAARGVTIDLACRIVGVDPVAFVAALNARRATAVSVRSLPVLDEAPAGGPAH